jgi:hypothetical protein
MTLWSVRNSRTLSLNASANRSATAETAFPGCALGFDFLPREPPQGELPRMRWLPTGAAAAAAMGRNFSAERLCAHAQITWPARRERPLRGASRPLVSSVRCTKRRQLKEHFILADLIPASGTPLCDNRLRHPREESTRQIAGVDGNFSHHRLGLRHR